MTSEQTAAKERATCGFREATLADRDGILALRRSVFVEDDAARQGHAFWDWEFASSPLGPSRIFVAEDDGGIVGHLGFVPQRYRVAGRSVHALLAVDAMVHARRRRESLFSSIACFAVDRLRRDVPLLVAWQIREAVLAPMLSAGFEVAATVPLLLRPASIPLAFAQYRMRTSSHAPITRDTEQPARNGAIELRTPSRDEIASILDVRGDAMSLAMTPELFAWRFQESPVWRYRVEGAFRQERLVAMIVVRDTTMKGMPTRAIVHVEQRPGCGDATRALLRAERMTARESGVGMIASLVSRDHPARWPFFRAGLLPGPFRFRQLVQSFDSSLTGHVMRGPRSLTWASTDHA